MYDSGVLITPLTSRNCFRCVLSFRIAYALRFQGRKRVHNADEIMAEIVAKRLVDHLERAGFVVMKKPTDVGAAALGRGHEG